MRVLPTTYQRGMVSSLTSVGSLALHVSRADCLPPQVKGALVISINLHRFSDRLLIKLALFLA
jgi:hypothetical protein